MTRRMTIPAPEQVADTQLRLILIAMRDELLALRNAVASARSSATSYSAAGSAVQASATTVNAGSNGTRSVNNLRIRRNYRYRDIPVRLVVTEDDEPVSVLGGQQVLCYEDCEVDEEAETSVAI